MKKKTTTLSDAQHKLLRELITGRVIVEDEFPKGKFRYFLATVSDNCHAYGRPRYIRSTSTVYVLVENGLIEEFFLWPGATLPQKAYRRTEKAIAVAASMGIEGRSFTDAKVHKKEFWCNGEQARKYGLSDGYPK